MPGRSFLSVFCLALCFVMASFAQETTNPSMLPEVRVSAGNSLGSGTVFYLDQNDNAYVLSNYHVANKTGSRVGVEFWADGKLYPMVPGVVVAARIDGGYVDVAIIRVAAQDVPGTPQFVPLAQPGTKVSQETVLSSRGSPGGTWQTQFFGRCFASTNEQIKFWMRPGGGRSGSSMQRDGQIVGLLTWSSGKPSWEEHGTDGMNYKSGFGIAQQIDSVWAVARGQTTVSTDSLPPDYTPLVHFHRDPQSISRPSTIVTQEGLAPPQSSQSEETDEGFRMTPEDQDALLRRRGNDGGNNQGTSPPESVLPPLQPHRAANFLAWLVLLLITLAVFLGAGYMVGYMVYRKMMLALIGFAFFCSCGSLVAQNELESLAAQWSRDTVATGNDWGRYATAYQSHQSDGGAIVTLVCIPGCAPCEELKKELRELDRFGYFNESHTSIVDAQAEPEQARILLQGVSANSGYPVLIVQTKEMVNNVECVRKTFHVGKFPSDEEVEKRIAETPAVLDRPLKLSDYQTLRDFLIGSGVK